MKIELCNNSYIDVIKDEIKIWINTDAIFFGFYLFTGKTFDKNIDVWKLFKIHKHVKKS